MKDEKSDVIRQQGRWNDLFSKKKKNRWMDAYEELCQHIEGQPEQARLILANRESDTYKAEPNNYRSTVTVETANTNINA